MRSPPKDLVHVMLLKTRYINNVNKLEKIIHKKETNQNKAMDLLRILERIEITEEVLSVTKIDLKPKTHFRTRDYFPYFTHKKRCSDIPTDIPTDHLHKEIRVMDHLRSYMI